MNVRIDPSWQTALKDAFDDPKFAELTKFVKQEYQTKKIYPPPKRIFAAFDTTPFEEVKVVIIGQDPYHGAGQANGLCFSVADGVTIPPSLQNIYKEIHTDLDLPIPQTGNLEHWATQGVLLLNATLTVEANKPGSHQKKGWEEFTDAAIRALSEKREHLVFILWGAYAQKKGAIIDRTKHLVLTSAHPSPFSVTGFYGCKHFSKANAYLREHGIKEIDWIAGE